MLSCGLDRGLEQTLSSFRELKIGAGAVVGAGSIVSRSIPEGCTAAGNPARVIRNRFNADD